MKINKETLNHINLLLYATFSLIQIDIEGSNLEYDKTYFDDENYPNIIKEEEISNNKKVIFKNIELQMESCDCGGDYSCSHGSYVYEIIIINDEKRITVEYTDGDSLEFYNEGKCCRIPVAGSSIFDFIRMCQICEIELELTDYAVSLLNVEHNYC